jgi:hypothetical protein
MRCRFTGEVGLAVDDLFLELLDDERQVAPQERLAVTEHQVAARGEPLEEAQDDAPTRPFVHVDEHVAAEDHVDEAADRRVEEVRVAEVAHGLELAGDGSSTVRAG